jgi:hypothetical protein
MEKQRWEESEKRNSQKKEDAGARKGRKVAKHRFFVMFCGTGGSKSRLAKAAGAKPSSGCMRDEKLHAVMARSRFGNEKLKDRRFKPLEVEMFKRRTPLWRETYFQVNMLEARRVRRILESWRC